MTEYNIFLHSLGQVALGFLCLSVCLSQKGTLLFVYKAPACWMLLEVSLNKRPCLLGPWVAVINVVSSDLPSPLLRGGKCSLGIPRIATLVF